MTDPLFELREYLSRLPEGKIKDVQSLIQVLAPCWKQLSGSGLEAMTAWKLQRMEGVEWHPPTLNFVVERHGGTVMGSTRAQLQHWTIDADRGTAHCHGSHGYRQLHPRDAPLDVETVIGEVVGHIIEGSDDSKLEWLTDRSMVRVLVPEFVTGQYKRTMQGRRKRFRKVLEERLKAQGWVKVSGRFDVFQRTQ